LWLRVNTTPLVGYVKTKQAPYGKGGVNKTSSKGPFEDVLQRYTLLEIGTDPRDGPHIKKLNWVRSFLPFLGFFAKKGLNSPSGGLR